MAAALTRRLLLAVPTLFGMSIIVFAILRLVPGDAVSAVLGLNSTPALERQMRHRFHLDEGIVSQYVHWLGGVLRGDFGYDYRSGEAITTLIGQALPVTLELVIVSLLVWRSWSRCRSVSPLRCTGVAPQTGRRRRSACSASRSPTSGSGSC